MTFQCYPVAYTGFIQDFMDLYWDQCRLNDVHVG